jgi:hypothetical protein
MLRKIAPVVFLVSGIATLHADTPGPDQTVGELQIHATEMAEQIKGDYQAVIAMQARARRQKDVIKLNCVNDKLIQIKAEMNIADSADQQLRVELSVGTKTTRRAAYGELRDAGMSIHDLRQQAAACLGQIELGNEEQGATSTHPAFPDDPSVIPFDVYVEPPAYASPYN